MPHDTLGTWRLMPWDGGPVRPLGVASGDRVFATDRDHRWLALTRDDRVYLRPLAGPLDTPVREVASFKPSEHFPLLILPAAVSSRRDRISFWDALILTAAAVAGCEKVGSSRKSVKQRS